MKFESICEALLDDAVTRAAEAELRTLATENPEVESRTLVDERGSHWMLIRLDMLKARRDAASGAGTRYMEGLCDVADRYGFTIVLQTATRGDLGGEFKRTTSVARLKQFYSRFGFTSNSGRMDYRPELPGNMHRNPRK